jgi:hypothetical protein
MLLFKHLRYNLFAIFVGGPHCLWCFKNRWNPSLGTSVALEINKNGLELKKLWLPKVGGVIFTKHFQSNSS